jgi:hypothetical protein
MRRQGKNIQGTRAPREAKERAGFSSSAQAAEASGRLLDGGERAQAPVAHFVLRPQVNVAVVRLDADHLLPHHLAGQVQNRQPRDRRRVGRECDGVAHDTIPREIGAQLCPQRREHLGIVDLPDIGFALGLEPGLAIAAILGESQVGV